MKNTLEIVKTSPHFVVPSLVVARKSAIGELSSGLPDQVKLTAAQEEVLEKAVTCQHKSVEAMLSYWELCVSIRKHKMEPKVARSLLFAAGFPRSRVSEILTVVASSDRIFLDYANRAIGFRLALAQARADKADQTLMALPDSFPPAVAHSFVELLGDKKKASFEVEGVKITLSRSKPAENTKPAVKVGQTKKDKKS